jgi:aminoglycoside phosphotransferase (APT) family kinase protein
MDATQFDWGLWRSGDPWSEFQIPCRSWALIANKGILRRYAVGWCRGENLICRPKLGHTAVMFWKGKNQFWFHFRNEEFEAIWTT